MVGGISMKTKFNFDSQICTTREQSEHLLALGLKKETADMFYAAIHKNTKIVGYRVSFSYNDEQFEIFTDDIPAWSLHRLLCILPKYIQVPDNVWGYKHDLYLSIDESLYVRYEENVNEPCFDKIFWKDDIYQSCISCIEWLIKEGYFNKEYLI